MVQLGVFELIKGIFTPAAELIDALHTSKEEKLIQKTQLLRVQAAAMDTAYNYELKTLEARANIVNSEAKSEHWLTANWRPITMLVFVGLIVARFLGFHAEGMSEAEYLELWLIVKLGIGGYIGARSGEKIVATLKG